MRRVLVIVGAIALAILIIGGVTYFIYVRILMNRPDNSVSPAVPATVTLQTLVSKYPLDAQGIGAVMSYTDPNQVIVNATISSFPSGLATQPGDFKVKIRNDEITIKASPSTLYNKRRKGATSIADSGYEVVRSDEMKPGDFVTIAASYSGSDLYASMIQKQY